MYSAENCRAQEARRLGASGHPESVRMRLSEQFNTDAERSMGLAS
jgi:hypothetical protein